MSNSILNALNTPVGGQITGIGPVKISARYPAKDTTRSRMRTILAKDNSGEIQIVLYGAAADAAINDGGEYTFKSTFKRAEYNGKAQITIDGALSFEGGGGSASGAGGGGGSGGGGSRNPETDLKIARQNALTNAVATTTAAGPGGNLEVRVNTILDLAERFANFTMTGKKTLDAPADNGGGDGGEPSPF